MRRRDLTRYVSPFGSPATMDREVARGYLRADMATWDLLAGGGLLTEKQLRIGPPRLDDTTFRLAELPEWVEGDDFDTIRPLVQAAESRARATGERYVVAVREGRSAQFQQRYVIDGDDVRWETR